MKRDEVFYMNDELIGQPKLSIFDMTRIAAFTALLSILAQISIPFFFGIPLTLQTFGVYLICLVATRKIAFWSIFLYVLLGTIGIPIFANFSSGPGVIIGNTGGYIFGFMGSSILIPYLKKYIPNQSIGFKKYGILYLITLTGVFLIHLFGMAQFSIVTQTEFIKAIKILSIFLPIDFLKAGMAVFTAETLISRLKL